MVELLDDARHPLGWAKRLIVMQSTRFNVHLNISSRSDKEITVFVHDV